MNPWFTRLLGKRAAYRRIFHGEDGVPHLDAEMVLADLRKFVGADRPSISLDKQGRIDPLRSIYMEGRREVYMRIMEYLNANDAQIHQMMQSMEQVAANENDLQ